MCFLRFKTSIQRDVLLQCKRLEVYLADVQDKLTDISFRNVQFQFPHIHLAEIKHLLYQSLQLLRISLEHDGLLPHGRNLLIQIIRYAGYDGKRCQQLMGNIGEVSQLGTRQFFLQSHFTLQFNTTHIKPDYHIKAQSDENDINKICKPGFIEGRLFHNGQQYLAFSPLTSLIFQLQTEFIRSLRQVVIEGGISVVIRIDPIMIHPLQLIRYATSRIQRIQKRRKENLNIPIIRTKENLMYRILSRGFRIAEEDTFVFNFDICDMQARRSPVHHQCINGTNMYESTVSAHIEPAPTVQADSLIPENIYHNIIISSRIVLKSLRINIILKYFLIGDNPHTVLIGK